MEAPQVSGVIPSNGRTPQVHLTETVTITGGKQPVLSPPPPTNRMGADTGESVRV